MLFDNEQWTGKQWFEMVETGVSGQYKFQQVNTLNGQQTTLQLGWNSKNGFIGEVDNFHAFEANGRADQTWLITPQSGG